MTSVSDGNMRQRAGRASGGPPQRLLTPSEAAAYLGYSSTQVLKFLPVDPLRLASCGLGAGPRYDKVALDRWIDNLSGLTPPPAPSSMGEEAALALEEWRLKRVKKSA